MLVVYWRSGESEGTSDLLPSRWFEAEGQTPYLAHTVTKKSWRVTAHCSLAVRGNIADLDYGGVHIEHNRPDCRIGVLRLVFSDPSRKSIQEAHWRDEGLTDSFEVADVSFPTLAIPRVGPQPGDPPNKRDARRRAKKLVVERQGQPAFRAALIDAYEGRCAVTGCTIDEALEAAHIMPYRGKHTNDVTNGLLLRADIHLLFDQGLIEIGSDYRIIARPDIRASYGLPATITVPHDPDFRPSPEALSLRADLVSS